MNEPLCYIATLFQEVSLPYKWHLNPKTISKLCKLFYMQNAKRLIFLWPIVIFAWGRSIWKVFVKTIQLTRSTALLVKSGIVLFPCVRKQMLTSLWYILSSISSAPRGSFLFGKTSISTRLAASPHFDNYLGCPRSLYWLIPDLVS